MCLICHPRSRHKPVRASGDTIDQEGDLVRATGVTGVGDPDHEDLVHDDAVGCIEGDSGDVARGLRSTNRAAATPPTSINTAASTTGCVHLPALFGGVGSASGRGWGNSGDLDTQSDGEGTSGRLPRQTWPQGQGSVAADDQSRTGDLDLDEELVSHQDVLMRGAT